MSSLPQWSLGKLTRSRSIALDTDDGGIEGHISSCFSSYDNEHPDKAQLIPIYTLSNVLANQTNWFDLELVELTKIKVYHLDTTTIALDQDDIALPYSAAGTTRFIFFHLALDAYVHVQLPEAQLSSKHYTQYLLQQDRQLKACQLQYHHCPHRSVVYQYDRQYDQDRKKNKRVDTHALVLLHTFRVCFNSRYGLIVLNEQDDRVVHSVNFDKGFHQIEFDV